MTTAAGGAFASSSTMRSWRSCSPHDPGGCRRGGPDVGLPRGAPGLGPRPSATTLRRPVEDARRCSRPLRRPVVAPGGRPRDPCLRAPDGSDATREIGADGPSRGRAWAASGALAKAAALILVVTVTAAAAQLLPGRAQHVVTRAIESVAPFGLPGTDDRMSRQGAAVEGANGDEASDPHEGGGGGFVDPPAATPGSPGSPRFHRQRDRRRSRAHGRSRPWPSERRRRSRLHHPRP